MTDLQYTLLGYAVGVVMLLGYAAALLWKHHSLDQRARRHDGSSRH